MICPHCKKPIQHKVPKLTLFLAAKLHRQGYSTRDIEKTLAQQGMQASFATISRHIKKGKKK